MAFCGAVSGSLYVEQNVHLRLETRKSEHDVLPTLNERQEEIHEVVSSKTAGISDEIEREVRNNPQQPELPQTTRETLSYKTKSLINASNML